MIALKKPSECAVFARVLEPYVDGELDASHAVDIEAHVLECALCSERVALVRATRQSLKRTAVSAARRAPDALRARVQATIAQERQRSRAHSRHADDTQSKPGMKYVAAIAAAAAGVVFAIGVSRNTSAPKLALAEDGASNVLREAASEKTDGAAVGLDAMLDDLVALHKHPLPPETTNPEELQRFEPLVGVPVRRPAFQPFGARFNGARVHAMRERRAALLQYTVGGDHRVTVYVFDPRVMPMMRATSLTPRVVRERPVFVGKRGGYSIAAAERSGIGYALATDLNDDESATLVLAAAHQP
jgi:anti-sigma factor RsiW